MLLAPRAEGGGAGERWKFSCIVTKHSARKVSTRVEGAVRGRARREEHPANAIDVDTSSFRRFSSGTARLIYVFPGFANPTTALAT